MSEIARTGVFVAAAALSMGLAYTMAPSVDLKPSEIVAAKLGEQFYPDFKDPNEPTSLSVVTFNEKDATAKPFSVQFKDGLWTIPSHHNYPADGAERLAKTSASAIGIKRDELRSGSAEDHVELGVVDPLDQDGKKLKGRGQRITLKKGDSTLMDLIIGKQVRNRQGFYYVRKPEEKSTYVAKIDIDLSTKFADWVETDLLKLDRDDLRVVSMNNYSIDEAAGRIVDGDLVELSRDKSGEPWKLKGLDDKSEELETAKVNDLVNTLDDLKLTGIRRKPEGLSDDLKLNQGIQLDQVAAMDLRSRGYFVVQGQLLSNEGQLDASTEKGVVYTLRFGEIFAGDDMAVEAGIEADKKAADAEAKKDGDAAKKDEVLPEGPKANRYLFVTAFFDENLVGPKPVKPTPPEAPQAEEKPAEEKPAASDKPEAKEEPKPDEPKPEEKKDAAEKADGNKQGSRGGVRTTTVAAADDRLIVALVQDEQADEKKEEAKPEEPTAEKKDEAKKEEPKPDAEPAPAGKPADKPTEKPADDPAAKAKAAEDAALRAAEDAKIKYEDDLKQYEDDLKKYEEKVKAGKEQVAKLNRRFADWYYVISAESFNKLHVARKDVVKSKTPVVDGPAAPKTDADPKTEAAPKPEPQPKPEDASKPEEPAKPADKPEEKPEAKPEDKPDAPKGDDEKPEDAKPDAKPEVKPDDAPKPADAPKSE